jgi:hypothetical protein
MEDYGIELPLDETAEVPAAVEQTSSETDLQAQLSFVEEQIATCQNELNSASFYLKRDLHNHMKDLVNYKNEIEQELQEIKAKRNILEHPVDPEKEAAHYKTKAELKTRAKARIGKKFIVGHKYMLRFKNKGIPTITSVYECKQYVYTMDTAEINMVIMKRLKGKNPGKIYTLSRTDAKRLHVKFEPGLECFPMDMNWLPYNEK